MTGSVAGSAPRLEFSGHGVPCLFVRRVVVEFEKLGALTIDAFVVVGLEHDTFLPCGWVAPTVRCIDGLTVNVVQHQANEGLVETLTDCVVGERCPVVECLSLIHI